MSGFSYAKASEIASKLNVEPAVVLAVAEVESGGRQTDRLEGTLQRIAPPAPVSPRGSP